MSSWCRKFVFRPRYRREEAVTIPTDDGLRLAGAALDGPEDAFATVVLVPGLTHTSRTPPVFAFAHLLARDVHVVVTELRGHGRSEGACTLGREEPRDVASAVAFAATAYPSLPVVTIGVSLGGAAVLLHAGSAQPAGVAGAVAVSSPGWWGAWETVATRRVQRFAMTFAYRLVLSDPLHTRIAPRCEGVPDARDTVANISPAFTLIVHDRADHYFGPQHAETLYAWAREPKALWWEDGAGHGSDLLTPGLAARLVDDLRNRCLAAPASCR